MTALSRFFAALLVFWGLSADKAPPDKRQELGQVVSFEEDLTVELGSGLRVVNNDAGNEAAEIAKLRELMAPLAINNTVIVVPANIALFDMTLSLRCRLRALGATNFFVLALDAQSAAEARRLNVPFYFDPESSSTSDLVSYGNYAYTLMMAARPDVWRKMLGTGIDLLLMDADVIAFQNPNHVLSRQYDLEGQMDPTTWPEAKSEDSIPMLCPGLLWVRASPRTMAFMAWARDYLRRYNGEHPDSPVCDQHGVSEATVQRQLSCLVNRGRRGRGSSRCRLKRRRRETRLKVFFYAPEVMLNGHLKFRCEVVGTGYDARFKCDEAGVPPFQPAFFHLNAHLGDTKRANMTYYNWWQVEKDGTCADNPV